MYLFIYETIITLDSLLSGIEDRLFSMKAPKKDTNQERSKKLMRWADYESVTSVQQGAFIQVQNWIYQRKEGNNSQLLGGLEQEV
jgi:hypothetical protein